MKNIHVIPTDKPSRLVYNSTTKKLDLYGGNVYSSQCKNIYITSDEEIKEGEYGLSRLGEIIKFHSGYDYRYYAKIILTTDQHLIKEGVQAIDDDFLEWFVKNPSCEFINIYQYAYQKPDFGKYKIIIPKEETKQSTKDRILSETPESVKQKVRETANKLVKPKQETLEQIDQTNPVTRGSTALVSKQETLEEAAAIYAHRSFIWPLNKQGEKQSIPPGQLVPSGYAKHKKIATKHFTAGYKLAQERMYSEEEVLVLLQNIQGQVGIDYNDNFMFADKWFEKFKKKIR
jgi:hypothetical protein